MKRTCPTCEREYTITASGKIRSHKSCGTQEPAAEEQWSSKPSGRESAKSVSVDSSPGTSSVPTGKEATSMSSAPVDDFLSASPKEMVRNGRYYIADPVTGKERAWTRVTNFARMMADEFGLGVWRQCMVVKGMTLRPDLVERATGLDVKADWKIMSWVVEQAKNSAGASKSADLGTIIHKHTENVDGGGSWGDVPAEHRADVRAYADALSTAGIRAIPEMIERVVVAREFGVAGKFDRVLQMPDGTCVIGDVKTGADLSHDWLNIAIQLYLYTVGVNEAGVRDIEGDVWDKLTPPIVSEEYAIVMHIPAGSGTCTLYRIDLRIGAKYARLCLDVKEARKDKGIWSVWVPDAAPDGDVFGWRFRFSTVTTRAEASDLYAQAKDDPSVSLEKLNGLVDLAKAALHMS